MVKLTNVTRFKFNSSYLSEMKAKLSAFETVQLIQLGEKPQSVLGTRYTFVLHERVVNWALTWAEAINDYEGTQKDKLNPGIPNKAIDQTLYVHFQIRSSSEGKNHFDHWRLMFSLGPPLLLMWCEFETLEDVRRQSRLNADSFDYLST